MSALTTRDWQGEEQTFEYVGWKSDRSGCFAFNGEGEERTLQIVLPRVPDLLREHPELRALSGLTYPELPFPRDAVPVEIKPTRLRPPPCRPTVEKRDELFGGRDPVALVFSLWEMAYGDVLVPDDEEQRLLRKRFKKTFTQRHEPGAKRYSFEDALGANACGILDVVLHPRWAKKHDFKLEKMESERRSFRSWVKRFAVSGWKHLINTGEIFPALTINEREWEVLEASVRYEVLFQLGCESRKCWLSDFVTRPLNDAAEVKEFDACVAACGLLAVKVAREDAWRRLRVVDRTLRNWCKELGFDANNLTEYQVQRLSSHGKRIKDRDSKRK